MSMKRILVGLMVLLSWTVQAQQDDCQGLLRKVAERMRVLRQSGNVNGFEMKCRIVVTAENGEVKQEPMEVMVKGNKYHYKTGETSLYQDSKTMVVVQRAQRTVFLTKAIPDQQRQDQLTNMIKLQDSLQRHLELRQCSREFGTVKPGEGFIKMTFAPAKDIEGLGLRSITYWVAAGTPEITKIQVDYTPGSGYGIKKYELIVEKMDAGTKTEPFPGEATLMAMQGGKLRSEFKNYQLIDKRN